MQKTVAGIFLICIAGSMLYGQTNKIAGRVDPDTADGLIFVKGGTFMMGSTEGSEHEQPPHEVTLSDFYISDHEVTQGEWAEVMGTDVSQQRNATDPDWSLRGVGDDHPMYFVSWYEAIEYCNRLSIREELEPVYKDIGRSSFSADWSANGYRLPTEAEWEYAAWGGSEFLGGLYSGGNTLDRVGWYSDNSGNETHPVGGKMSNALDLYDMSGNVWEWCWDWYDSRYYRSSASDDPKGAVTGSYRVLRGGSWYSDPDNCRTSLRYGEIPSERNSHIGFRVARGI